MNFFQRLGKLQTMSLWTFDRRPTTLSDVIGNQKICNLFQKYIEQNNIPDVILVGDYGTSKRTIAHIVAKQYLGKYYQTASMEIDGAIYRGKDVISSGKTSNTNSKQGLPSGPNVLEFSNTLIHLPNNIKKLIIIYNFNDMTIEAQNALRRIMEKCASTTRFILICNQLEDIIEAIQSRCIQLKTVKLTTAEAQLLISSLQPNIKPQITEIIILLADGDVKKIINYLQVTNSGRLPSDQPMSIEEFYSLFNIPPIKIIEQILVDIHKGVDVYPSIKQHLIEQGHAYIDIIEIICRILTYNTKLNIPESTRYRWLQSITEKYCNFTLYTEDIHIYSLFADLVSPENV